MSNRENFKSGEIFGNLIIVEKIKTNNKQSTYLCKCNCGKTREVYYTHLKSGKVTHCGCLNFTNIHGNKKFSSEYSSYRAKASNYKALHDFFAPFICHDSDLFCNSKEENNFMESEIIYKKLNTLYRTHIININN